MVFTKRLENKKKFILVWLAEKVRIPVGVKYSNPRKTFEGINWWISVAIDAPENIKNIEWRYLGIVIGIKLLQFVLKKQNTKISIKLPKSGSSKKKKRRISEKYSKNKKGVCYCKTRNIIKKWKTAFKNHSYVPVHEGWIYPSGVSCQTWVDLLSKMDTINKERNIKVVL